MRAIHLVSLAALVAGCGGKSTVMPDAGPVVDLGPGSTLTDDEAAAARQKCTFSAGTPPGLSLGKDAPRGPAIPIDTVVILMMENRSFDHLLGDLPAAGQTDVEVAPAKVTNPDAKGNPIARHHLDPFCFDDTAHDWDSVHRQYDGGKLDGFVVTNEGGLGDPVGARAMGFHTKGDLPFLYGLSTAFAIADHYHCALLGPTFPNREYLYAATSFGYTDNDLFTDARKTIFDELNAGSISWQEYYTTLPGSGVFLDTYTKNINDHYSRISSFFTDAAAGTLESVVVLDPNLRDDEGSEHNDDHPPASAQLGDQFLAQVVKAVTTCPQWPHLALFITWDEHGGLYDHVVPPAACPPDDQTPTRKGDPMIGEQARVPIAGAFDRYGFRVPLIVVSPYAKPHYVSHVIYDHTSITRFVETRFLLPALTKRDANAAPLLDLFDFSNAAFAKPPSLPDAPIDPKQQALCQSMFPFGDGGASPDGGVH